MPLTEADIRAVLDEHSADLTAPPDLLGAVRHRVRVRRIRAVSSVAAVAAVAAATVLGVTLPGQSRRPVVPAVASPAAPTPAPSSSADTRNPVSPSGLPTYADGGKLLAGAHFDPADRRWLTLHFTPTSWHLRLTVNCSGSLPKPAVLGATVNGHDVLGSGCGNGSSSGSYRREKQFWHSMGVRLHQPSTVVLRVVPGFNSSYEVTYQGPLPHARVEFGVYQRVPVADYPFPPRPRHLAQVNSEVSAPIVADLKPTHEKFNGTYSATFVMRPRLQAAMSTVEPGSLTLLVNGVPVDQAEASSYDYNTATISLGRLGDYGLHLRTGQQVRITVIAKRFTDPAWEVAVGRQG